LVAVTDAGTPELSVLVVTYNHQDFVERALDSIRSQETSRTVEIVVADDNSTDATLDVVSAWAERNPEVDLRVLPQQARLGITKNYARGFSNVRGQFVAVLEGDDEWVASDKLELQAQALVSRPDLSMVANRVVVYNDTTGDARVVPEIGFEHFLIEISSEELAEYNWFATFSACMYRVESLAKIPAALYECRAYDWAINMAITEFGPAGLIPQAMTLYRIHSSGAWSGHSPLAQAETLREVIPTYLPVLGPRLEPTLNRRLREVEAHIAQLKGSARAKTVAKASVVPATDRVAIPRAGGKPRVSVVLTSFNNSEYLVKSVESVLAQTMPDFELVIIDDGSSDGSWSHLTGVSDPRVRAYRLDNNQGGAAALNYGIQEARSDLIAVINSDDEWEPTKLARQLEVLDSRPEVAAVFTGAQIIGHDGEVLTGSDVATLTKAFSQPNRSRAKWLRMFFEEGNSLCHPSVLIRRSFYEHHGLYDNRLRQLPDFARWITLVKQHEIVVLADEPLVRFRVQPNGRNTSHISEESVLRTRVEHLMVMETFFDGCSDELIVEAFGDVLRQRSWLSQHERDCVVGFLWLDFDYPLGDMGREQGRKALAARLAEPESARILAVRFGVTDLALHRLGGSGASVHAGAPPAIVGEFVESPSVWNFVASHVSTRTLLAVLKHRMRSAPLRSWPRKVVQVLKR
jgi:glycosyltransferase involved in cell wall biosynthesis